MKKQCYTLLMNVYHITGSHRYAIWFRHTLEPKIDRIPYLQDNRFKEFTLDELRKATQTLDITHMIIEGNIPPGLHQIAPNLKQLKLEEIPHTDQLQG